MKNNAVTFCSFLILTGLLFVFLGFQTVSSKTTFDNSIQKRDTLLNTENYLVLGFKTQQIKLVLASDVQKYPGFEVYKKHKDVVFLCKGKPNEDLVFYEKFSPLGFTTYSRKMYLGKIEQPVISKNSYLSSYKETIIAQCKAGINFAGYYTIVSFGCGTSCQQNLIINRKTGEIDGEFVTSMGAKFQKNSSLLIRNFGAVAKKTSLIELYGKLEVNQMNWNGKKLILVK